ncbi:hypothetical protein [Zavarzinella formosa]|uniref:hypothetical protein n=1 Tax=Zavarzinella formosa TaxID=360055 RepID=UPI0002DB37E0|nr:hypothetical protein [Zavarzinella formosa]
MTTEQVIIEGKKIKIDASGVGHNWKAATADNCPANIQEEIAAEIIDGGKKTAKGYVASNGQHYSW